MIAWVIVSLAGAICTGALALQPRLGQTCNPEANKLNSWSLSLHRYTNDSGEWMDLLATRDLSDPSSHSNMDVRTILFECEGRKMLQLKGTFKDPFVITELSDQLRFHQKTGPNAVLTNNGHTVQKIKSDDTGVVFTHRPLRPNELFEVKIDKRGTTKSHANSIGVTTRTPYDGDLPGHMNTLRNGTWMLYSSYVWINGTILSAQYSSPGLDALKAGDRIGVMRTDKGSLHFFINGVDQGKAASDIPKVVYGAYELYGDAIQATVIHSS